MSSLAILKDVEVANVRYWLGGSNEVRVRWRVGTLRNGLHRTELLSIK